MRGAGRDEKGRGAAIAALVLCLLLSTLACGPGPARSPVLLPAPAPEAVREFREILDANPTLAPLPVDGDALLAIVTIPDHPGEKTRVVLRATPVSSFDSRTLVDPRDARGEPGLYMAAASAERELTFLVRMGDPRRVRTEGEHAGGLHARTGSRRGGAFALRLPLLDGGTAALFMYDQAGEADPFLFLVPLTRPPRSGRDLEFEVSPR